MKSLPEHILDFFVSQGSRLIVHYNIPGSAYNSVQHLVAIQ